MLVVTALAMALAMAVTEVVWWLMEMVVWVTVLALVTV